MNTLISVTGAVATVRPAPSLQFARHEVAECRVAHSGFCYSRMSPNDPTGKSPGNLRTPLSSPFRKNILIFRRNKSVHIAAVPSHRGAARDRHERGTGCGGRRRCWRREYLMRTAKSCGPDAPTLASSLRSYPRNDGGKKARSPGRARSKS
jgi:hypothetical protein